MFARAVVAVLFLLLLTSLLSCMYTTNGLPCTSHQPCPTRSPSWRVELIKPHNIMSRQIIPSSKVADGQNITIDGGAISFHVASWLSEDNLERGLRWTCQVSPPRDISYAVNAENMVIMRDIQMRYPG